MKIAILSPQILGVGNTTATYSSQQINLARCWADAGHRVHLITGRCVGLDEDLRHERIRVFQRRVLWLAGKNGLPLMVGGAWLLMKNKYDLVFSSEHYQPTTLTACLLSPNVVIYQGQNTTGSTSLKRVAFRVLDILFLPITRARYKKVIAKTHTAEEFVRARGFDKCVTIPCGYDTARFRTPSVDERSNSRSSWRIDEDSKVLVYAGNLLPRRDVATAIRALAKLRSRGEEAVFLIAGDGPELPKLRSLTRDLGIEESVHFLGQVNWEKLRQAFWAADIFVFPTHYEIFGMVLIEALACGLQIVSTPCPAAKDILSECPNAGRIVPVGDPLALAEACKTLFSRERSSPTSENSTSGYLVRTNWNSISKRIIAEITTSEKI